VDTLSASAIVSELDQLNERFPGRFEPAGILVQHARGQRRFYPAHGKPVP
jgi:hypothetical protein